MMANMQTAAQHLAQSLHGRRALEVLTYWLEIGGALELDAWEQEAVYTLLEGAWGGDAETAREAIADALAAMRWAKGLDAEMWE